MSCARAWVAVAVTLTACHGGPSARERVLAEIPAGATVVAVASRGAFDEPEVQRAWQLAAGHAPALACAFAAAPTAEEVALGLGPDGVVIAVAGGAPPADCAPFAPAGEGVWVARSAPAGERPAGSVLGDERYARARSFLLAARAALASEDAATGLHAIAVEQPAPLGGWLAVDGLRDADGEVRAQRLRAALGEGGRATRAGAQLVLRWSAGAVRADHTVAQIAEALAPGPVRTGIACPPHGLVDRCTRQGWYVESVPIALAELGRAATAPVVANGAVVGYRLGADLPDLGLVRGDELVAIDDRPVGGRAQLEAGTRARIRVGIRRDGALVAIDLISE